MAKSKDSRKAYADTFDKDEEELALERIVFGDSEGFESGLRDLDLENFLNEDQGDDASDAEPSDDDKSENEEADVVGLDDAQLFFVDDDAKMSDASEGSSSEEESEEDADDILDVNGGLAAWIDSDDERLEISLADSTRLRKLRRNAREDVVSGKDYVKRLRARFEKIYPVPLWAQEKVPDQNSEDEMDVDSDDEIASTDPLAKLLQTTSRYISMAKSRLLPQGTIDIDRLKDANESFRSNGAIQSLQFHPTHPILLTTGFDQTLRLYHIDGKKNPLATSLHIRRSPFKTALFHSDGTRIFAGGRRKQMHIWNIETGSVTKLSTLYGHDQFQPTMERFTLSPCGRFIALFGSKGWMNILSASSGQWMAGAKVEGELADAVWSKDGNLLMILSTSGEVWEWDSKTRVFIGRWQDEGAVGACTIALGGKDNRWCAIGSESGIVNVYDRHGLQNGGAPSGPEGEVLTYKPRATLGQLTTAITSLVFSPDGQILAMASKNKPDALRLVHVPSFTVFKNWPTQVTPLGRVTALGFTPGGEMLSVGNLAGKARLWKFNHYT